MSRLAKYLFQKELRFILGAIGLLLFVSLSLRVPQLGYSHFYGDEIKTLYLRKDISASDFLLNQRKGPLQFLVVWGVEKISGGYSPLSVRLPFALAGTTSVILFFFFVRSYFNQTNLALISSLFYALSGIYIAFSRTAQYQSLLMLFGLFSLLMLSFIKEKANSRIYLFAAGSSLGLALLSHYDAIFFLIPSVYMLTQSIKQNQFSFKGLMLYYFLPLILTVSVFYIPYIVGGFMQINTVGYISKRVLGIRYAPSYSVYTQSLYNPFGMWLMPFFAALGGFVYSQSVRKMLVVWFLLPFVFFEFFVANPGTHIHNYFVPMFVLAAFVLVDLHKSITRIYLKIGMVTILVCFFSFYYLVQLYVFSPLFDSGYPWKSLTRNYQVFVYGFPYNRGWDQLQAYFKQEGWPRSFYTNDNTVVGSYYLNNAAVYLMNTQKLPEYYINVLNNQELKPLDNMVFDYYVLKKLIFVDGDLTAEVYRYDPLNAPNSVNILK